MNNWFQQMWAEICGQFVEPCIKCPTNKNNFTVYCIWMNTVYNTVFTISQWKSPYQPSWYKSLNSDSFLPINELTELFVRRSDKCGKAWLLRQTLHVRIASNTQKFILLISPINIGKTNEWSIRQLRASSHEAAVKVNWSHVWWGLGVQGKPHLHLEVHEHLKGKDHKK